ACEPAAVCTGDDEASWLAPRPQRGPDFPNHFVHVDKIFPSEMPTAFRKSLIFNVTTRETSSLEFTDCPRHILRSAKSSIRIDNCRNVNGGCNVTSELHHFGERKQPDVWHARRRIGHPSAADINGVEPSMFHLPRDGAVRDTRHRNTTFRDQLPQRCALVFSLPVQVQG